MKKEETSISPIILLLVIFLMGFLAARVWFPREITEQRLKKEMIKAREKEEINKANNQCVKAFEQDFPEYKNFGCWYKVNFSICLCQTWEVKNAWERAHTIYDGERDVKEIRFNLKPLTPSN